MSFEGPETRDYENVVSLNLAWLECLKNDRAAAAGLHACPATVTQRLTALEPPEAARLAESPFLLFSFRERDDCYWDQVLARRPGQDLFGLPGSGDLATLSHAALGFIWQLSNRNPYALRLFCGASLYWCERIGELTFFRLLEAVSAAGGVPVLRLADNSSMWQKLLQEGLSRDAGTRHAAQYAAMQTVLTDSGRGGERESRARAARKVQAPGYRVAEDR
jgi:hypothetical protein